MYSVLILGVDEEANIIGEFLRTKDFYVEVLFSSEKVEERCQQKNFEVCILDVAFQLENFENIDEAIVFLKEKLKCQKVYCMSYLNDGSLELPMYEDGHIYKPLTRKDLEILYKTILNDEKKELVCLFLGLRFYASPERASLLKMRVEDMLLKAFEHEGLVSIDTHIPPVDLTPTITNLTTKKTAKKKKK